MNKEYLRMQKLAGVITEGQYKEKLEESKIENIADEVADNPKLDQILSKLSPEKLEKMSNELKQLGITPETSNNKIVDKVEDIEDKTIDENEKSTKEKVASVLSGIGTGLIGSLLVPLIPVAIGSVVGSVGVGFAATAGAAALLKGLAKALDKKVDSGGYKPTPG